MLEMMTFETSEVEKIRKYMAYVSHQHTCDSGAVNVAMNRCMRAHHETYTRHYETSGMVVFERTLVQVIGIKN